MSLIIYTSALHAPGTLQPPVPRYEIGKFFITIYHANRRTKDNDESRVKEVAATLIGCLGKERPMFINQYHPSLPTKNSDDSIYKGTSEEVHDSPHRLGHYHIELMGLQRDAGFTDEEIDALKNKLNSATWT
jgi:hypothetical protein